MNDETLFEEAAELLQQADALLVCAGAGMGVDSGLPDFRGNEGFWRAYPALARAGLNFTEIANPRAFAQDPELAWGFYGHRLQLYRDTVPHEGFALLKAWGERLPNGAAVFTSNVDGQFQAAGFDTVHECHGSIHWLQCLKGCGRPPEPADALRPDIDETACRWRGALPRCACGALLRPNILMFGDGGWDGSRYEAQAVRLQSWLRRCERPLGAWAAEIRVAPGRVAGSNKAPARRWIGPNNEPATPGDPANRPGPSGCDPKGAESVVAPLAGASSPGCAPRLGSSPLGSQRNPGFLPPTLLVVELGAGTAIPSVRRFGEAVVLEGGGRLLRINPREAALPRSLGLSLPMGALAALRGIEAALQRDDQRGG
ncbi:NAD-dependent deacetylase [Inhella sp.]|uniref:SIR2 family NAD-dependent protein deacylase n=1 Tax=Inhella sp. TaxID=1921806 RepID=UPI0035B25A5F